MSDQKRVAKLKKVIGFYEQELDVLKIKFQEQNAIVEVKKNQYKKLVRELEMANTRFQQMTPTAVNHQHAMTWMDSNEEKLTLADRAYEESKQVLEERRLELQKQMSKIESLEKLVAKKMELINERQRKREQQQSDERYLNTQFSGKSE